MIEEQTTRAPTAAGRVLQALGELRTRSGLLGQSARYVLAGALVSGFYVLVTTILALVVGLPFQVALAVGFCLGLVLHFVLQRVFVWSDRGRYALRLHRQAGRYLLTAGAQYAIMAAATSQLPAVLGLSSEVIYVAAVPLLSLANFLLLRYAVFHGAKALAGPSKGEAERC